MSICEGCMKDVGNDGVQTEDGLWLCRQCQNKPNQAVHTYLPAGEPSSGKADILVGALILGDAVEVARGRGPSTAQNLVRDALIVKNYADQRRLEGDLEETRCWQGYQAAKVPCAEIIRREKALVDANAERAEAHLRRKVERERKGKVVVAILIALSLLGVLAGGPCFLIPLVSLAIPFVLMLVFPYKPPPIVRRKTYCWMLAEQGLIAELQASAQQEKRFPCPRCGGSIPVAARVCQFCNADIETEILGKDTT